MRRRPLHIGLGLGIGPDLLDTGIAGVTRDGSSLIYTPASSSEWTALRTAAGLSVANPNSLWLAQEASGNLADSIGSVTLTASGSPTYQQTVTGWSRKAVAAADGSSDRFTAGAGVGPNPTTTSQTWLAILAMPAVNASTRVVWGISVDSNTNGCAMQRVGTTGVARFRVVGVNADSAGSHANQVIVAVVKFDRTGSAAVLYSNLAKVVGTYSASVVDQLKGFGSIAATMEAAKMLYGCMWSGANAEISDANIKALLQAMGWSIPWS